MATTPSKTKVITGRCRLSYVHVFEPFSADPDQPEKYSVVVMVPKSDTATLKKLKAAQKAALENGVSSKFGGRLPKEWHSTIKDGDDEDVLEKNPEYEGYWVFSASAKTKPGIVDRAKNEIEDSTEVYSGCFARVSLNAFPYNNKGNKGVSFGLNHIQKLADGDYLGGRSRAEDDFDDDLEDDELDADEDGLI